jgi:phenol hydroxylase P5 protein
MRNFNAVVQSITSTSPQTYLITLQVAGDPLVFVPGQYVVIFVPQDGKMLRRLYSIASSSASPSTIDLFIKVVPGGAGSTYLTSLTPGSHISGMGPAGMFKLRDNTLAKVFMTTGTGFAPVRSFLLSQRAQPTSPWLALWGEQTHAEISFFQELQSLTTSLEGFRFYYCLSRETSLELIPAQFRNYSRLGRITKAFDELKTTYNLPQTEFYLCGSRLVVEGLREYLSSIGVEKENIIFEKY